MHELAVTEQILDLSLKHLHASGGRRLSEVYLVIGEFASVVDDSVSLYWDMITGDTPAQGSRLHFRRSPARWRCADCGAEGRPPDEDPACPACHGRRLELISGDEFFVEAIEVEGIPEEEVHGRPRSGG